LEARGGIEPPIKVLQTFAFPLGDRAFGSESISRATPSRIRDRSQQKPQPKQKTHLPDFLAVGRKNSEAI
jgi:hypothetical protein